MVCATDCIQNIDLKAYKCNYYLKYYVILYKYLGTISLIEKYLYHY